MLFGLFKRTPPMETRAALLRDHLGPALKREGFKGAAPTWRIREPGAWGVVNVQQARYNTQDHIRFTVNFGVALDTLENFGNRAPARQPPKHYECHWRQRIGTLMRREDYWWTIQPSTRLADLARAVVDPVIALGVLKIRSLMSDSALDLYWSGHNPDDGNTEFTRLRYRSILALARKDIATAEQLCRALLAEAAGTPALDMARIHARQLLGAVPDH